MSGSEKVLMIKTNSVEKYLLIALFIAGIANKKIHRSLSISLTLERLGNSLTIVLLPRFRQPLS
mgnify:CR=1 FL=1